MVKTETQQSIPSKEEILNIETKATQLMHISKIIAPKPSDQISALLIAAGATAATFNLTKAEALELVAIYYDRTDAYLSKMEEGIEKAVEEALPPITVVKKDTSLN